MTECFSSSVNISLLNSLLKCQDIHNLFIYFHFFKFTWLQKGWFLCVTVNFFFFSIFQSPIHTHTMHYAKAEAGDCAAQGGERLACDSSRLPVQLEAGNGDINSAISAAFMLEQHGGRLFNRPFTPAPLSQTSRLCLLPSFFFFSEQDNQITWRGLKPPAKRHLFFVVFFVNRNTSAVLCHLFEVVIKSSL